jgi:ABC-type dipeptide/oligopeptide/nickel transport system permease subunit
MSLAALGVIALVVLGALAAPVIMPYDPDATDAEHALEAPGRRHWLGTDLYGRDQLARIVHAGASICWWLEATPSRLSAACSGRCRVSRGGSTSS